MKDFTIFTNYKIDEKSLKTLLLDKFNLKIEDLYSENTSNENQSDCRLEFENDDFEYKFSIRFWCNKKIDVNYLNVCREISMNYKTDILTGVEWEKNIQHHDLCLFESDGKCFSLFDDGYYDDKIKSLGYTDEQISKLSINIFPMFETKKEININDLDNYV